MVFSLAQNDFSYLLWDWMEYCIFLYGQESVYINRKHRMLIHIVVLFTYILFRILPCITPILLPEKCVSLCHSLFSFRKMLFGRIGITLYKSFKMYFSLLRDRKVLVIHNNILLNVNYFQFINQISIYK